MANGRDMAKTPRFSHERFETEVYRSQAMFEVHVSEGWQGPALLQPQDIAGVHQEEATGAPPFRWGSDVDIESFLQVRLEASFISSSLIGKLPEVPF